MFGPRDVSLDYDQPTIANSLAFATLADVKTFLNVTGSADDTTLTRMINAACKAIEAWCGMLIAQRTVTETFYPQDPVTNLVLTHAPVISLTSLTIDDAAQTVGDFAVGKASGFLRRKDGAQIGGDTMIAVYTAGFATAPEAVKQATFEFVKDMYGAKDRVAGVASESLEGVGSVSYTSAMSSEPGAGGAMLPIAVSAMLGDYARRFGA